MMQNFYVGQFVGSVGDGIWFTLWVLFFTQFSGISAATMGYTVAAVSLAGVLLALPIGHTADRLGARTVFITLNLIKCMALIILIFSKESLLFFFAGAALFWGINSVTNGIKTALICDAIPDTTQQLAALSRTRVIQHVGYAAGAGIGALILYVNSQAGWYSGIVFCALSLVAFSALSSGLPNCPGIKDPDEKHSLSALKDFTFSGIMLSGSLLAMCWGLMSTGFPLWIKEASAPAWTFGVMVTASSVLIILFQTRASSLMPTTRAAGWGSLISGGCLALCCIVIWQSYLYGSQILIFCALACLLHVAGEIFFVSSRWSLSLNLMDHTQKGKYLSITSLFEALVQSLGPALIVSLIALNNHSGWLIMSLLFALTGLLTASIVTLRFRTSRNTVS